MSTYLEYTLYSLYSLYSLDQSKGGQHGQGPHTGWIVQSQPADEYDAVAGDCITDEVSPPATLNTLHRCLASCVPAMDCGQGNLSVFGASINLVQIGP